ncbi:MAG TPA: HEAT repeat domain-containing protein [Acidobacteriota bacterium]|nr:HEAT repeat domain-containing protein [Acidobacteriota bacterium]
MPAPSFRPVLLLLLALVFTIGLTFATVELPYVIDDLLQRSVSTPSLDSHADSISRFKTELFIDHYHLRLIGYICFALTVLLIIIGFATRKSGLATVGALAFMLPVFAQFAGVMFFLAGLGLLNVLWLPILDISFDLQRLGLVIRAPYDLLMWGFHKAGYNGYWPIVIFFIGGGLLVFFIGTFAWLSARTQKQGVADSWVYRFSRHPQYLGWIMWSYGMFLLLMQQRYPKRSWGIDASLPWLLSTMIIIGVAMIEELRMRRRYGDSYDLFRRSRPFLFPLPRIVRKMFALPLRLFYRKDLPERKREVAVVLTVYTALLIGASALFYTGGWTEVKGWVTSSEQRTEQMTDLATRIVEHPNWRAKYYYAERLAAYGDPAVDHFIAFLDNDQEEVRALAARYLGEIPSERAIPALTAALDDTSPNVRGRVVKSLAQIGSRQATEPMMRLLDDPEEWVRREAARSLAELGVEGIADRLIAGLNEPSGWARIAYADALGILGTEKALPALIDRLNDEQPLVRRSVVVALMKIGSTDAFDALQRATLDEDWEVRVYAAEALRRLRSEAAP